MLALYWTLEAIVGDVMKISTYSKPPNIAAKNLRSARYRRQIVRAKAGKGSYSRKQKHRGQGQC